MLETDNPVFRFQKLMIQMNSKYKTEEIEEEDNAMEADVSDEEMARR